MSKIFTLFILICFCQSIHAQWTKIETSVKDFDFETAETGYILKVEFLSPSSGYNSTIYKTEDRGNNWEGKLTVNYMVGEIQNIMSDWIDTCYYYENCCGSIYSTLNGGSSWEYFQFADVHLEDISFTSSRSAYLVTNAYLSNRLVSVDEYRFQNIITTDTIGFKAIDFLNDSIGFFISHKDKYYSIYRTYSPNIKWTSIYKSDIDLNDMVFVSDTIGYVVGDSGLVLKTTNLGVTWDTLDLNIKNNLNCIDFIKGDTLYCAGDSGIVIGTKDGGKTWKRYANIGDENLIKIEIFEDSLLYILSSSGNLYNNQFSNKTEQTLPTSDGVGVLPNPFDSYFAFTNLPEEPYTIQVFAIDGKQKLYKNNLINKTYEIDASRWENGIYLATVSTKQHVISLKLIKN